MSIVQQLQTLDYTQAKQLKTLLKHMSSIDDVTYVESIGDYTHYRNMDASHVCLIDGVIPLRWDMPRSSLNVSRLLNAIESIKLEKWDTLNLGFDYHDATIEHLGEHEKKQQCITLYNVVEAISSECPLPKFPTDVHFACRADDLKVALTSVHKQKIDFVRIMTLSDHIEFQDKDNKPLALVESDDAAETGQILTQMWDMSYLYRLRHILSMMRWEALEFSTAYHRPIKVEFQTDFGKHSFWLAPRLED